MSSRALLLLAPVVVAASALAALGLGPPWLSPAGGAAACVLAAGALWQLYRGRRAAAAIEQALLAFSERDFSTRLELGGVPPYETMGLRFNALGEKLRAVEADHHQRELMLESVVEATPSAVVLFDAAERVALANVSARELLFAGARLEGHALAEVQAKAPAPLRESLSGVREGLVTDAGEAWFVAQRRLELGFRPHRLVMVKPLTRELLRQEADAWKRAIRVVSHEINNALAPLTSLVSTARRIAGKPEHAPRLEEAFDTIAGRATHLQRFLDGYAQFARLPRPSRQEVEWRPFLEKLSVLHPFVMPEALPTTRAKVDPAQLQAALVNLLKNALESGSPVEQIRVTVAHAGESTVIEVSDAGQGMTPEQLEQVMVPFHSTKKTGTGLGLALAREVVEAHGGQVAIRSSKSAGTTVRCVIPDDG